MTESSPATNGDSSVAGAGVGTGGGSGAAANVVNEEKFGPVVLTISNSVLPLEKLSPTPSSLDGMSQAVEDDLRNLGCDLIQTAGKLLKLRQVAMATACVLFQRFFYSKSFVKNKMEHVAMASVCLACKIEEDPRRPRDVINVFSHIKQVRLGKPIKPVILDSEYVSLKRQVINMERRVLKDLGFCVHIKHPHKLIVMYLQLLGSDKNNKFVQMSWNFMNDSLRTDIFVRYQPETIACACIYLSARKLGIPLPKKPAWFELLNVEEDDIRECCYRIICLYQRIKPNQEDLEKIVDSLKAALDEKRKQSKLKETAAVDSPNSQAASPVRKEKTEDGDKSRGGDVERSRSRSNDRNRRKKKHKQRERSNSGSDRDRRDKKDKKSKRERSWSRSPIRKERRGDRSRSRDRQYRSSGHSHDRRDKYEHKNYQDKYKKGERIERDHYRR